MDEASQSARELIAASGPRMVRRPPVVVPAGSPCDALTGHRVEQLDADIARRQKEWRKNALLLLEVRRVADDLVHVRLLDLAVFNLEKPADHGAEVQVGESDFARAGLRVVVAFHLDAHEILDRVTELQFAAGHEPERAQVP